MKFANAYSLQKDVIFTHKLCEKKRKKERQGCEWPKKEKPQTLPSISEITQLGFREAINLSDKPFTNGKLYCTMLHYISHLEALLLLFSQVHVYTDWFGEVGNTQNNEIFSTFRAGLYKHDTERRKMIVNINVFTHIPACIVGLLSITLYCALNECFKCIPVSLPCKVTLRYRPEEYTGYGRDVPQKVPSRGEVLLTKINILVMGIR